MAELSVPYMRRQIARRSVTSSGGVPGAVRQPAIPDVSGLYGQVAGLGEDITEAAGLLGQVAARRQKARDTATLTAIEASVDEQVAAKSQEILRDATIHPFDYRQTLQTYRDSLLESLQVPDRLREMATAKVQASTQRYLISLDAEGTKRGVDMALQTLDLRADQLIRQQVAEPDANQRAMLDGQIRDLYKGYVESGIMTGQEALTRLTKVRDQSAVYQVQQAIRLDPDRAVAQLEKGLQANAGIPPAEYGKLVDEARRVQRERFHFAEAQEAKIEKDTLKVQKDTEAMAFGQVQAGKLGKSTLDRMRTNREISPQGYETLVRYMDTRARENRAEARAAESLTMQRADHKDRQTEADLSILASTGQINEQGILDYAKVNKLRPTAIDGAIVKAQSYRNAQNSEWRTQQNQAEQMINKAFTKGPFEVLESVTAEAYSAALDELTRRSKAFGGQEDPLVVARDLIPKYQAMLSGDAQTQLQGIQDLLLYPTPDLLEADRANIPPTTYKEQQRLFRKADELMRRQEAPTFESGRGKKSESGAGFWQRWFGGGQ